MTSGTTHRIPGTLPPQATGFVGRQAEIAQVSVALMESRLVTIAGTGGVGKTRVAVRVAAQASGRYPDGVHLVELSAVRDPAAARVHRGGQPRPARPGRPAAAGGRPRLPARAGAAAHPGHLRAPGRRVRRAGGRGAARGARGHPAGDQQAAARRARREHLPAAPAARSRRRDEASDSDAVALFAQRAAAVVDGFTITGENRADVIGVCRALDGIPLAIELATVRLRALPLDQMASRLDDRFHVLTGGKRAGLPRHQTLRAAIEWSHDLCTPTEQVMWARLSVFAGTFDLAAAVAVCADDELSREQVVESLIALAEKSVLVIDCPAAESEAASGAGQDARYRMLDTLREFGAERLAEFGRVAAVRRRLVAHYLALAQRWGDDPMQRSAPAVPRAQP